MSDDWYPSFTNGSFKRWRSTSKSKSGPVQVYCPLEELRKSAKALLGTEMAQRLEVKFEGPTPSQEDLLVLLGMWVSINVKGAAPEPCTLLATIAPYMREDKVMEWFDNYCRMTVRVKEA